MKHKLTPYSKHFIVLSAILLISGVVLLHLKKPLPSLIITALSFVCLFNALFYSSAALKVKGTRMILCGSLYAGTIALLVGLGDFSETPSTEVDPFYYPSFYILATIATMTFAGIGGSQLSVISALYSQDYLFYQNKNNDLTFTPILKEVSSLKNKVNLLVKAVLLLIIIVLVQSIFLILSLI